MATTTMSISATAISIVSKRLFISSSARKYPHCRISRYKYIKVIRHFGAVSNLFCNLVGEIGVYLTKFLTL